MSAVLPRLILCASSIHQLYDSIVDTAQMEMIKIKKKKSPTGQSVGKGVKSKPAVMMYLKRASPIHRILSNQRIICSDGEPRNALNGSDAERRTVVVYYRVQVRSTPYEVGVSADTVTVLCTEYYVPWKA